MLVQFNALARAGVNGWAFSTDNGLSWTYCNAGTGCPGGSPVPLAGVAPSTPLLGRFTQVDWLGDPSISASLDGRTVVMSNIARSTQRLDANGNVTGNPDAVVVSASIDGGRSFVRSEFANSTNCVGYFEDLPTLAADRIIANRYWIAWRHRGTEPGFFGGCARGFDVDPGSGAFTFITPPTVFPIRTDTWRSVGSFIPQARDNEVTIVYSNASNPADSGCDGGYGNVWLSITSLDRGFTWTRQAVIDSNSFQDTCLPSATYGVINPGIHDFAFVRDSTGLMWAAVPWIGDGGFEIFRSDDIGISWHPFDFVGLPSFQSGQLLPPPAFFPSLAADDANRIGLSFQQIDYGDRGRAVVQTWFTGLPANAQRFLPPIQISAGYLPANEPLRGSCGHELCEVGVPLSSGCDPAGCVSQVCAQDPFCCIPIGAWSYQCRNEVGKYCGPKNCGGPDGRLLGDYAGIANLPTGATDGGETFLSVWTQSADGDSPTVAAAIARVFP